MRSTCLVDAEALEEMAAEGGPKRQHQPVDVELLDVVPHRVLGGVAGDKDHLERLAPRSGVCNILRQFWTRTGKGGGKGG